MKIIYNKLLLLASVVLFMTGCFEDKGNYNYIGLADFFVDTTGLKISYTVSMYAELDIPSGLVYDGDKSGLSFTWRVYEKDGNFSNPAITLAETEDFREAVAIDPGDYWLEFCATEKNTGRTAAFRYALTVESMGSGFLVLYKKNGMIDCDLVRPKLLLGDLDENMVARQMYSQKNPDVPLQGEPVAAGMFISGNYSFISLYTDRDGVQLSPYDMSLTKKFENMFLFPPQTIKPEGYSVPFGIVLGKYDTSDGSEVLINDGVCYFNFLSMAILTGKEAFLAPLGGDYVAAPYPFVIPGASVIYDQKNMRYMSASLFGGDYMPVTVEVKEPFDFSNLKRVLVYQSFGFGGTYYVNAIFRNPVDDGSRYLYVMSLYSSVIPLQLWDISSYEGISEAELFAFGRRGPLAFYAVGNKVYRIPYDLTKGEVGEQAVEAWPYLATGETITCMKLCPYPGKNVTENLIDRYLMIATYNEATSEGKLYFVKVDIASGVCDSEPAAVFEHFGKIRDITFKF